jgi:hypothetical protein
MEFDTVTLRREQYEGLMEKVKWLQALEAAGVDNWDGISYAHELFLESE